MAFPLTMGITDPPVIALTCLALALLARAGARAGGGRRDTVLAALALGAACAMKYTAWPALAIVAVMVAARDGVRPAVRFAAGVLATAAGLVAALAPAALRHPASLLAEHGGLPARAHRGEVPGAEPAARPPARDARARRARRRARPARGRRPGHRRLAGGLAAGHACRRRAAPRHRADRAVPAVAGDALRLLHLPDQPVRVGDPRGRWRRHAGRAGRPSTWPCPSWSRPTRAPPGRAAELDEAIPSDGAGPDGQYSPPQWPPRPTRATPAIV